MGIPLRDIPKRDRSAYYSDTIVFRVRDNKPFVVVGFNEDNDDIVLRPADRSSNRSTTVSLDEMQNNFILYRPTLGWRNTGIGCLFGTSKPGRGYKKGYLSRDIRCVSPIYDKTSSLLEKAHAKFILNTEGSTTSIHDHEKSLDKINKALGNMEDLYPRTSAYLKAYTSPFVRKEDAPALLHGNYLGVAITPNWAMIQLPSNSKSRASIFYQDSVVGSIDLNTCTATFFKKCKELSSAWDRLK